MAEWALEAQDPNGRWVRLGQVSWESHILPGHPELREYLREIGDTLSHPDFISRLPGCLCYYRFGLGRGKFAGLYLRVIVRYNGEEGRITTAHFTSHPSTREVPV